MGTGPDIQILELKRKEKKGGEKGQVFPGRTKRGQALGFEILDGEQKKDIRLTVPGDRVGRADRSASGRRSASLGRALLLGSLGLLFLASLKPPKAAVVCRQRDPVAYSFTRLAGGQDSPEAV